MEHFGVRKTKVGVDAKKYAYVISRKAVLFFSILGLIMFGGSIYYSIALKRKAQEMKVANGWEESDNIDEETQMADYFFQSAEILMNIVESEQQNVEDGVIVSQSVLNELDSLKDSVGSSTSMDQLVSFVEQTDVTLANIVKSYADSNHNLANKAKQLSKTIARVLSQTNDDVKSNDDAVVQTINTLPEWKEISTWHRVARCFDFVTDVTTLKIPASAMETLIDEMNTLEAGVFPSGRYERPTDVREEMQLLLTDDSVKGVKTNFINNINSKEQVKETLREIVQVTVAQENLDDLLEIQTQWQVDKRPDVEILEKLEGLEQDGIIPLFWISGHDIMGVRVRKFLWWERPSVFDVIRENKVSGDVKI